MLKNPLIVNGTEEEVHKAIMLWLRNAPDRHGRRKQRERASTDDDDAGD